MAHQLHSIQTRARIIGAAVKPFIRFGYEAISIEEICVAANVGKGAFYHHFSSKQALF